MTPTKSSCCHNGKGVIHIYEYEADEKDITRTPGYKHGLNKVDQYRRLCQKLCDIKRSARKHGVSVCDEWLDFKNYYDAKTDLLNAIATKAKSLANTA